MPRKTIIPWPMPPREPSIGNESSSVRIPITAPTAAIMICVFLLLVSDTSTSENLKSLVEMNIRVSPTHTMISMLYTELRAPARS